MFSSRPKSNYVVLTWRPDEDLASLKILMILAILKTWMMRDMSSNSMSSSSTEAGGSRVVVPRVVVMFWLLTGGSRPIVSC
jgi:hypothetical protein